VADFIQIGLLIKGNKQNEKIKTKVS